MGHGIKRNSTCAGAFRDQADSVTVMWHPLLSCPSDTIQHTVGESINGSLNQHQLVPRLNPSIISNLLDVSRYLFRSTRCDSRFHAYPGQVTRGLQTRADRASIAQLRLYEQQLSCCHPK